MKSHNFKNIKKKLSLKYYANERAWMITTIFTWVLRALDAYVFV